ncbi:hypothetical protein JAAARDRAFT_61024 [Jaapia argillacea MUCL 33604]|uniref:NYN domain-containing protein n=1 Tax=Jaapia argillacea MUCL 33604 TaxID=933084 RepID=A0A067PGC8_9AGAM|nr:hypothetical protein JAAARDRAFT_61024 [Jaapia argillacea MUCL 33604]
MAQSNSDTTSPTPFSPFSTRSVASEGTSDEAGDLGAFTSVFRALNYLRQPSIPNTNVNVTPTSSLLVSPSDYESDAPGVPSAWSQDPIAPYLSESSQDTASNHSRSIRSDQDSAASDTEGDVDDPSAKLNVVGGGVDYHPSLGYLDEALNFIAAERARLAAQREARLQQPAAVAEPDWKHPADTRRKRRRRKAKSLVRILRRDEDIDLVGTNGAPARDLEDEDDDSSQSSPENSFPPSYYKSTPPTPPRTQKERRKQRALYVDTNPRLGRSRSTPSLRLTVSVPLDPKALQLRALAHKLRLLFPEDISTLSSILSVDSPESSPFVDPRGPSPRSDDAPIHVFVDHSNILIGFLNYLKRHLHHSLRKGRHLSHAALALILERGRPISRRVLVTSSPLYQPMDSAEQLGYEVRVYARVPDTGDGQDRQRHSGDFSSMKIKGRQTAPPLRGHAHKKSNGGSTSTESDQGVAGATGSNSKRPIARGHGKTQSFSSALPVPSTSTSTATSGASTSATARLRYREQGVDELLQLKFHQAIADVDIPPPNATIVLATGDGNVGQFNEEGFLGCVRTALKKGWRVELYAWEDGLSRAWMREFGEGPFAERFRIVGLEKFGADLIEI